MATDPRTKVRSSNMLWGDQVGIVNAIDAMDTIAEGPFSRDYAPGGSPTIYHFTGGRRFVAPRVPYI